MINVIERLKDIKTAKGLTNQQISDLTGVPIGTVSRLFANELSDPKWTTISQIAEGLELDMNLLCGVAKVELGNIPPSPIARTVEAIQFDKLLDNARERIEEANLRHKETCEHYEDRINDLKRDKRILAIYAAVLTLILICLFTADFLILDRGWIQRTLEAARSALMNII